MYVTLTGTVRARNADGTSSNRGLSSQVERLPTPHGFSQDGKSHGPSGNELGRAVNQTLRVPSSRAMDGSHGAVSRTACVDRRVADGQANLAEFVLTQRIPTPTNQDSKNSTLPPSQVDRDSIVGHLMRDGETGSLNPDWVEWLMNWPIGWSSTKPLDREWVDLWHEQTSAGNWWRHEPPIPRVSSNVPERAKRLKSIGNGQVPSVAHLAWTILRSE